MNVLGDKPENASPHDGDGRAPTATFHARVASVGLITTVVVLLAACLTFMLQQWAVARTQSHRFHEGLAEVTAQMAGPSMAPDMRIHLGQAIGSVRASKEVVSASVTDASGRQLAGFHGKAAPGAALETIERPVMLDGRPVGRFTMTVMQPSLAPMLWRYRQAVRRSGGARLGRLTTLVGAAYYAVWIGFGIVAFGIGVALAAAEMERPGLARAVPIAAGVVVVIAGALQFTAWKAHHLACCREAPGAGRALPADAGTAWLHGIRLGLHCGQCCAGLMAMLLALGVMDLRAMAVVTAAITVERVAPAGQRVARAIGLAAVAAGALLIARAVALA